LFSYRASLDYIYYQIGDQTGESTLSKLLQKVESLAERKQAITAEMEQKTVSIQQVLASQNRLSDEIVFNLDQVRVSRNKLASLHNSQKV
jgi:hypothetical protein